MAPKKVGKLLGWNLRVLKLIEAYPQMAQRFKDTGWFNFFTTFQGHDEQVSMLLHITSMASKW
jgi:hypothetical protein